MFIILYNGSHMNANAMKDLYCEGYLKIPSKLHETFH